MTGARVLELGAGMGLAGLALAALGARVLLTDVASVLPLLRVNADRNLSRAALAVSQPGWAAGVGGVSVAELDWENKATWHPQGDGDGGSACDARRPYDVVIACDCIYKESMVPSFVATLLAHTSRRSLILVVNERRSDAVVAAFDAGVAPHFSVRRVPRARQHPEYQHENIHMLLLKRKADAKEAGGEGDALAGEVERLSVTTEE